MLLCVAHFSLDGSPVRKENDLISNLLIFWILEKMRIASSYQLGKTSVKVVAEDSNQTPTLPRIKAQ